MSVKLSEKHGLNPSIICCFFCGKETNEIALLGRLPQDKEAPRKIVTACEPCEQCKKKAREEGFTFLVEVNSERDRKSTGRWLVIQRCDNKDVGITGTQDFNALLERIEKEGEGNAVDGGKGSSQLH